MAGHTCAEIDSLFTAGAAPDMLMPMFAQPKRSGSRISGGQIFGFIGLFFAVTGLFLLTVFLEPLAIVFGLLAWRSGEKMMGRITIVGACVVILLFIILYCAFYPESAAL